MDQQQNDKDRQMVNLPVFEKRFLERIQQRAADQDKLFNIIKSSGLDNKSNLPNELWLLIVEFACPESDYHIHIVFQRKYIFVQDNYYLFSGSLDKFCNVMKALRQEVDLQLNQLEFSGRGIDTPVDVIWLEKDPLKSQPSRWTWLIYEDEKKYKNCISFVDKMATSLSRSGKYDIRIL